MSENNYKILLPHVIDIARDAGRQILAIYNSDFAVHTKDDKSPFTAADLASNRAIVKGLHAIAPDLPILSEESTHTAFEERKDWIKYWLVDPLDGTKEFIKRNSEFTVNIALIREHKPVLGVVYVPVSEVCYYGAEDVGSFKQTGYGRPRPIKVSEKTGEPIRVVGSRSHPGPELADYLKKLGEHELTPMGSSLKFCLVAEGQADIYPRLGPTCEWDTAAAQAVVECAGGYVTDTEGNPLRYNEEDDLLNPHFLVFGDDSQDWRAP